MCAMKKKTNKDKMIQKFIDNDLKYWMRQKNIFEANRTRQHNKSIQAKMIQDEKIMNYRNEYNKHLGEIVKNTHIGLIDRNILNRRDELYNILNKTYA